MSYTQSHHMTYRKTEIQWLFQSLTQPDHTIFQTTLNVIQKTIICARLSKLLQHQIIVCDIMHHFLHWQLTAQEQLVELQVHDSCLIRTLSTTFITCDFWFFVFRFFIHLKPELVTQFPALNDDKYIDRKGIPPCPGSGEYNSYLCIFHHLKLELLTQFPSLNDEKYFDLWKLDKISQIERFKQLSKYSEINFSAFYSVWNLKIMVPAAQGLKKRGELNLCWINSQRLSSYKYISPV